LQQMIENQEGYSPAKGAHEFVMDPSQHSALPWFHFYMS